MVLMAIYGDPRLPYHRDNTRVFHRLASNDSRSAYYNRTFFTEFTDEQRAMLNEDRLHSVNFYSTDPDLPFTNTLYATDVTFYFPVPMTLTGIFLGATDLDNGFEYQVLYGAVSKDTTALDDGTWIDVGHIPVSTQLLSYAESGSPDEYNQLRVAPLNRDPEIASFGPKTFPAADRVAWDAPQREWPIAAIPSYEALFDRVGIGIVPLYGEHWREVRALQIATRTSFDSIGERVVIHLYGRPTDPNDAGLSFENADGSMLRGDDLDWGNMLWQSGAHVLGPFRLRNTTELTAEGVEAQISGTLAWGLTDNTSPDYADELYSPIMPFVRARIGGGPWQASTVMGKHISLPIGDLAPGEFSDDIEVSFDYNGNTMPPWSKTRLVLSSEAEAWS
jgi:hypothetical protein